MKAIIQNAYGGPEVLRVAELDKPTPSAGDVLICVQAMSVHAGDVFLMQGAPYPARFATGWPKPKNFVPGLSAAGVVEAVGSDVQGLRVGDRVFGEVRGACAQYGLGTTKTLVRMPEELSFEQAATLGTSALAALQGLRDAIHLKAGQRILIIGAAGGVGHFAVQIAKAMGAHVTGVCGTSGVELVRSLGADEVIDYSVTDVTTTAARYHVILDNVGNRPFSEMRVLLEPGGIYVPNSGRVGVGTMLGGAVRSMFVKEQGHMYLSAPNQADLETLARMATEGSVRPHVSATFTLEEAPQAIAQVGEGHVHGKLVVLVDGCASATSTQGDA